MFWISSAIFYFFLSFFCVNSVGERKIKSEELDATYWNDIAQNTLRHIMYTRDIERPAKNIIFFLGDGMSISTVTATRIYDGQLKGFSGEDNELIFEKFPNVALSKTYNVDKQVPDSAGTATAFLCGVKANYHTIGVTGRVKLGDCDASLVENNRVYSVMKWAQDIGKESGLVTTMRVTHATPAGLYAHVSDRDWESDGKIPEANRKNCHDIASQLIHGETGKNAKVIFGGGKKNFLSNSTGGVRIDGKNLIDEWIKSKQIQDAPSRVVYNKEELFDVDVTTTDYLLGLFNDDHMTYETDKQNQDNPIGTEEPSLSNMTRKAIEMLQKSDKGYFLLVEGGKIDWAHHSGNAKRALAEAIAFNDAIKIATEITSEEDTLIIVTADHSHVMTINGYPERGSDILGTIHSLDEDMYPFLPYTTLMYTNGPGYRKPPPEGEGIDIREEDTDADDYHQLAAFPKAYETHGGDDVAIYARGPWAHLFRGVVEQNYIAHVMAFAGCYKGPINACDPYGF